MYWVTLSCLSLTGVHAYLIFSTDDGAGGGCPNVPLISMIWLGITYSLCASVIWPILALIVHERHIGTGYGIMTAIQNAGFAFFPSIIGAVLQVAGNDKDLDAGYLKMEIIFLGTSAAASVSCFVLLFVDWSQGSHLSRA